jgi:endonuclease YncB( thermonuclease family)
LQAAEATERLAEILTAYPFTIEQSGIDRYGRVLARFGVGKTTAGEMLVAEGLARPWRGRVEEWCSK